MKTAFIFWLTAQVFLFNPSGAEPLENPLLIMQTEDEEEGDPIDCRGNLPPQTPIRSALGTLALNAYLNVQDIMIEFNYDAGMVDINITDASGALIYWDSVDSQDEEAIIPIVGFSPGTYTITFSNSNGQMWGQFEL